VEVIAEGPRNILGQFLEMLREGPFGGDVAEVEEAWTVPSGAFENFEIWPTR
jgi:acylphosphatase